MTARSASPTASPLFLREAEVRRGIELMYFGYTSLTRAADARLAAEGLGRAHQRALYFIARQPGLRVSALLRLLGITKQSLGRVLAELTERGFVGSTVGDEDRRQRHLRLTQAGMAFEAELFDAMRERLSVAYSEAGQDAVSGFWQVLQGLVPVEDRALILDLAR